ncbi:transcriptional repressor [Candidatus Thorarchaeota archaeon]|nr:MAG: transcriptional repressor [Candidatus Thorarchaeota archaeon]
MISSREEIVEIIRGKGYRATPQRILVYEGLWMAGSHPNVSDIHKYVSKIDPSISLATVYKNLDLFSEIGLVREIGSRDHSTRYDPDVDFHINLICNRCGKIEDHECVSFDEIVPNLKQNAGFEVQSHHFEVRGLCAACRNKQ